MSVGISNNTQNLSFSGLQAKGVKKRDVGRRHIELTPNSPVSDAFVKEMAEGIASTGVVGKKIIRGRNLIYILAQKLSNIFPAYKNTEINGFPIDTRRAFSYGDPGNLNGVVCLLGEPANMYPKHPEYQIPALIPDVRHETGHELHKLFGKIIGIDFTETKGYTEAYLKDIEKLAEKVKKYSRKNKDVDYYVNCLVQNSTPNNATKGGKKEAFAVNFAKLNGGSEQEFLCKGMDKILGKLFPNTTTYIEKLLYLLGKR